MRPKRRNLAWDVAPVPVVALGHSDQPAERFLEILKTHNVQTLVDIRRFPGSKRVPWAGHDVLPGLLAEAGIGYVHAPDLGGRRDPVPGSLNTAWRNAAFRGYADHMQSAGFEAALERLIEMAHKGTVAILCAEAVPWRCHRSLVADALVARGVDVVQAFSPTDARPHKVTPFAKVQDGRVTYPGEAPLV